jgi:prophage DNA circulation protein
MAWKDTLLAASFRGVTFDCLSTTDGAQRAHASHEYPYRDGADVEDLGRGARRIQMRAIFFGADYESRLQAFLAKLDEADAGELIHPVFGSIKQAQLVNHEIGHEADDVDQCSVSMEFLESTTGQAFFAASLPVQKAAAIGQSAEAVRSAAAVTVKSEIGKLAALANTVRASLARVQGMKDMLTSVISQVKTNVRVVLAALDPILYPTSWAADLTASIKSIFQGFPSFSDTSFTAVAAAVVSSQLLPDWDGAADAIASPIVLIPPVGQPAADIAVIDAHVAAEQAAALAECAQVVLEAEADQPTLTPPELETVSNRARDACEAAIVQYRARYTLEDQRPVVEALKTLALDVQEACRAAIELAPPIVTRTVEAPANMRLLAHRFYGDHTRAPELMRLNAYGRKPILDVGDQVVTYAQ